MVSVLAAASTVTSVGIANAADVKSAPPVEKASYQIIEGGEVQSVDPTAYNYVPKENSAPWESNSAPQRLWISTNQRVWLHLQRKQFQSHHRRIAA